MPILFLIAGTDSITQRAIQPFQDARLQQKILHILRLQIQNFFHQIIHDIAVAAGESPDKTFRISRVLEGKSCHLQAGNPTLRASFQRDKIVFRKIQSHHLDSDIR